MTIKQLNAKQLEIKYTEDSSGFFKITKVFTQIFNLPEYLIFDEKKMRNEVLKKAESPISFNTFTDIYDFEILDHNCNTWRQIEFLKNTLQNDFKKTFPKTVLELGPRLHLLIKNFRPFDIDIKGVKAERDLYNIPERLHLIVLLHLKKKLSDIESELQTREAKYFKANEDFIRNEQRRKLEKYLKSLRKSFFLLEAREFKKSYAKFEIKKDIESEVFFNFPISILEHDNQVTLPLINFRHFKVISENKMYFSIQDWTEQKNHKGFNSFINKLPSNLSKYIVLGMPIIISGIKIDPIFDYEYEHISKKHSNKRKIENKVSFKLTLSDNFDSHSNYYYSYTHHAFFLADIFKGFKYRCLYLSKSDFMEQMEQRLIRSTKEDIITIDNDWERRFKDEVIQLITGNNFVLTCSTASNDYQIKKEYSDELIELAYTSMVSTILSQENSNYLIDHSDFVNTDISKSENKDFGRLAELYFYKFLQKKEKNIEDNIIKFFKSLNLKGFSVENFEVIWENKVTESYKPYDFLLRSPLKKFSEITLDVKSARTRENKIFITTNELRFILSNKDKNYLIARVFHVASTYRPTNDEIKIAPEFVCSFYKITDKLLKIVEDNIETWEEFYGEKLVTIKLEYFDLIKKEKLDKETSNQLHKASYLNEWLNKNEASSKSIDERVNYFNKKKKLLDNNEDAKKYIKNTLRNKVKTIYQDLTPIAKSLGHSDSFVFDTIEEVLEELIVTG